ncbi:unnamed protein product [Oikopleura dioica]|uniref:Major facilitator superfamily (MFS) profile domain-containing protein n=1 Tax=Oikopleura dioica TaxID=34765 RepID=E4WSG4_OIKDI|nr:unnamed protein product [Oikopleura dioica]
MFYKTIAGNLCCVIVCVLETFFINGLWLSWGQITAILKEIKHYDSEYCTTDQTTLVEDCNDRDRLFNNIYTISNVTYALTALLLGVFIDKFGFIPARIISGCLITAGFTLMVFTEDTPSLIYAAWPLMAAGGVSNHIVNAKMALAIPTIKLSVLQALSSAFGAGGSIGLLINIIMDKLDVGVFTIFKVWAVGAAVISLIKLILWTPIEMPLTITTNTEYSLFENSYVIRKLRRKEATFSSAKDEVINELTKACNEEEVYTAMDVLKNLNFYILFLGHAGLTMRRGSYLGWLGSGWPEWVAGEDDPAGFNAAINKRQSQLAFIFLFLGLIPGIYCDMCRKFMNKNGSQKGDAFGLATSFITGAIMMSSSSFLQAQKDKDLAFASCILHNIGRAFSVMWNPAYFYLFPQNVYGFVFGAISVLIQPFTLLLIPILDYNLKNGEYATMNYVMAGLSLALCLPAIAFYRKYSSDTRTKVSARQESISEWTPEEIKED